MPAGGAGAVRVAGWAFDPDPNSQVEIHVYIDGAGTNLGRTSVARPDVVAATNPRPSTADVGFDSLIADLDAGLHEVCVDAINVGKGDNNLLGCPKVVVAGANTFGVLDNAFVDADGDIAVEGWAYDPDSDFPTPVYVVATKGTASQDGGDAWAYLDRPDVQAAIGTDGPELGFETWITPALGAGDYTLCVFGVDVGLGCRIVRVP